MTAEQAVPDEPHSANQTTNAGKRLHQLIHEYHESSPKLRSGGFVSYVLQNDPYLFSHHDPGHCDFDEHVINCRGWYLCRGCVFTIISGVFAFVVAMGTHWPAKLDSMQLAQIFALSLFLALWPLQSKARTWRNDARRIALGFLIGSACATMFTPIPFTVKGILLTIYIGVLVARQAWRRFRSS